MLPLAWLLPSMAHADELAPARAIRQPVRLTAGSDSDFMGVVAPSGAVYFVSDSAGTLDLSVQSPADSGPERLSSGLGDVAWPRVSPDGRSVAYVSFERDAAGDVCVRGLSGASADAETCIADDDSAELQVLWWDDQSLAVLSRRSLHADFVLRKVELSAAKSSTLLERNMVGMSLSPDRKWLAYVPLERSAEAVGVTFSNRTAKGLRLQRLGSAAAPIAYVPPLPGVTGYLAFGPEGRFLYFVQFLSDTNRDGAIDGDDNAVIFRVPFRAGAPNPLSLTAQPQQLTSARWDCHYPAPSGQQLIASCSHEGSLDVYSLPLDGAVPHDWSDQRLRAEIEVARDLWTQLLLSARRLELLTDESAKHAVLRHMTALHLALGEYESVIYYAEQRLKDSFLERAQRLTWPFLMSQLARHRRADQALIRGQLSRRYLQGERSRLRRIVELLPTAAGEVKTLAWLVISEIQDDVGDKADALTSFRRIDVSNLSDALSIPLVAERAQRLYRLLGQRQPLLEVYAALANASVLDAWYRLPWAQQFVEELKRGRSPGERRAAIERWRAKVPADGELGMVLELEQALQRLGRDSDEEVREQVFELYKREKGLARRRAIVLLTLQAAARHGSEYLKYQFVTSWASWLDKGHPERRYAEALYEQIVLDRAYGEQAAGDIGEARGYFYGTTVSTDSLEAHIGFIESRLAEGPSGTQTLEEVYEKRFGKEPNSPVRLFVEAYLSARELPQEENAEHLEEKVQRIEELLRKVQAVRPREPQVHQLWGFALHQLARRAGSRQAAVSANRHYLLALDLAYDDARLRASLLQRIGLLQAALGNHGVALRYLLERDQYPHVRPLAELGLRVAIARSAWHAGASQTAERHAQKANRLLDENAGLRRFRPIVLDRLALSQIDRGNAQDAWASYRALVEWQNENPEVTARNRMKARIGLAATALERGQPEQALSSAQQARKILEQGYSEGPESDWAQSLTGEYRYTKIDYDALVSGLQSVASRVQGDLAASIPPLRRRIEVLERQVAQRNLDEDRLDLARAYQQLASMEYEQGDLAAAQEAFEKGLVISSIYNENTGSRLNEPQLAMVRGYAELLLFGGSQRSGLKRPAAKRTVEAELRQVLAFLSEFRNPLRTRDRILLETYLAMLTVGAP